HHADVDRAREWRLAVPGAADPVRGHEAELDVRRAQPVGVLDAGRARFKHLDRAQRPAAVEQRLEGHSLTAEGAVALRRANPYRHAVYPRRSNGRRLPT